MLFSIWLWILGIVDTRVVEDNLQDLGKNRQIDIEHNSVKIRFSSPEEAEEFAIDLQDYVNKWDLSGQK
jgi:hypothetical protein